MRSSTSSIPQTATSNQAVTKWQSMAMAHLMYTKRRGSLSAAERQAAFVLLLCRVSGKPMPPRAPALPAVVFCEDFGDLYDAFASPKALMVIFRCTRTLLSRLGEPLTGTDQRSTGVLGDWYATILITRPRRVLLLVSETTRLPVVIAAKTLATMDLRCQMEMAEVLGALNIAEDSIAAELATMTDVVLANTVNRSLLATLNEFAQAVRWSFEDGLVQSLRDLSLELAETPILPLHDYPARMVRQAFEQGRT